MGYVVREAYFLTRNSRALVLLERKIVTLNWMLFSTRTSDSTRCAVLPKRTSDSGIFEGFSWSV
jgi:hypothetical protein